MKNLQHTLKTLTLLLLGLVYTLSVQAQIHPIQATVQLVPPYSVYLPDYAAQGRLSLLLMQRDLAEPSYQLYIRMEIKLNGKSIMRTSSNYRPAPFTIAPGQPVSLSGADLLPYFDANNLDFSGYSRSEYERTKSLPEGSYDLCFTAYDYHRPEVVVSTTACGFYYLVKAQPPRLNMPQQGTLQPATGVPLLFQWIPGNSASPNSALSTEYKLELFEVRPAGQNPKTVANNSRAIFTETLTQNQLLYTAAYPPLEDGMQYAWRVQAIDTEGRDAFVNKGFSEVFSFDYGGDPSHVDILQKTVQNLEIKSTTHNKAVMGWDKGEFDSYRLYYRKPGGKFDWFPEEAKTNEHTVFNLEPDTDYEVRVQGKKGNFYAPYSDTKSFRTEKRREFDCSNPGFSSALPKGDPLDQLFEDMILETWGFDVRVTSAVPLGNGWFSGTGVISVPFLHNYGIKIKFDRIYVNTLRQITDGKWYSDSKDRAEWIKEKLNSQGMISDGKIPTNEVEVSITNPEKDVVVTRPDGTPVTPDKGANDKNSSKYDGPYTITVTAPDGSKKQITVDNLPANIKDADGNIYTVDNKGKTEKVGKELSGNSKPQPADFAQVWFGNAMVTFSQGDNYAFDSKKDEYKGDYAKVFEPLDVQNSNNATYYVPFKASMAGSSVQVKANLVITNKTADTDKSYVKVKPEHVYFTTGKGVQLLPVDSTVQNANNISYTLKVPAGEARDGVEVYAMVQLNDERPYCIGKLKVVSYAPLTHKVVLVPVGGLNYSSKINISDVERTLKEVYEPIGINFTLQVDDKFTVAASEWDLNNDNKLKVTGSGAFGVLTNEMRALVNAYKETSTYNENDVYLFVLEKSDSTKVGGDMPRGKQFGYLFLEGIKKSEAGQLVAHELGHGLFTLQHSWNVLGDDTKKKTDNLMDYSGGTSLTKFQWDMAHNPELAFDWLKGDGEGMKSYTYIQDYEYLVRDGIVNTNAQSFNYIGIKNLFKTQTTSNFIMKIKTSKIKNLIVETGYGSTNIFIGVIVNEQRNNKGAYYPYLYYLYNLSDGNNNKLTSDMYKPSNLSLIIRFRDEDKHNDHNFAHELYVHAIRFLEQVEAVEIDKLSLEDAQKVYQKIHEGSFITLGDGGNRDHDLFITGYKKERTQHTLERLDLMEMDEERLEYLYLYFREIAQYLEDDSKNIADKHGGKQNLIKTIEKYIKRDFVRYEKLIFTPIKELKLTRLIINLEEPSKQTKSLWENIILSK